MDKMGNGKWIQLVWLFWFALAIFGAGKHVQASPPGGPDQGDLIGYSHETGMVSFIGSSESTGIQIASATAPGMLPTDRASALLRVYAPLFGEDEPTQNLQVMSTSQLRRGQETFRYQQSYQGVPILGAEVILNMTSQGGMISMSGELSPGLDLSVVPRISHEDALQMVFDLFTLSYQTGPDEIDIDGPELWIFDERLLVPSDRPAELVWRIEASLANLPVNELVLVNAETGGISLHFNQVDTYWSWQSSDYGLEKTTDNEELLSADSLAPAGTAATLDNARPLIDRGLLLEDAYSAWKIASLLSPAVGMSASGSEILSGHQAASFGEGSNWFVSPTGDDLADCLTAATPCATINGAIGKAATGDIILIETGTYTGTGSNVVETSGKGLFLSGGWDASFSTQSGMTTIDGQASRRGLFNDSSDLTIIEHFFITNGYEASSIYAGGAIYNTGNLEINESILTNNLAYYSGAGVSNSGGMTVNGTTISANSTTGHGTCGGGIRNSGIMTINTSTISGNASSFCGGGIINSGTAILNNSTVSGNTSGGIYSGAGSLTINNSTIAFNTGADRGGGISFSSNDGEVTIQNSIIAHNEADWAADCYSGAGLYNPITSNGYNLIGDSSNCVISTSTGDLTDVEIFLAPLGDYGGATQTHPILGSGSAVDAGNPADPGSGGGACEANDQRGIPRTVDGDLDSVSRCDIGAFEYSGPGTIPAFLVINGGTGQSARINTIFGAPLEAVVVDDQWAAVPGIEVVFTAPSSGPSAAFLDSGMNLTSALTDDLGVAISTSMTANMLVGDYEIEANVDGITESIWFNLNNFVPVNTFTSENTSSLPGTLLCDGSQYSCTGSENLHADGAHLHAIGVYVNYLLHHNRNSIDDDGMTIISTVEYCEPGEPCPYNNTYWDGSQIVYGSANDWPLADDVVAHEITHGVTEYTSNLFYYYQSGAISESFSDLWGEYYDQANGTGNDAPEMKWLLAEDVSGFGPLRSMSDPRDYGQPNKMSSPYYHLGDLEDLNTVFYDNGGVHTNSGVNNKAVYLMVDGDDFNGYTVTGIGWDKVLAIYYQVQTSLLTSGSDYGDLYYAVQQACASLTGGPEGITIGDCAQVKNALDAVEMNLEPDAGFNPDAEVCPEGMVVNDLFYDGFETGTTQWTSATTSSTGSDWYWFSGYATEGTRMIGFTDFGGKSTVKAVMADYVALPSSGDYYLHFDHSFAFNFYYDYENNRYYMDGGRLEYQIDGESWTEAKTLFESGLNYNGIVSVYSDSGYANLRAFVADSHGYVSSRYDLSPLAGQSVRFRWVVKTDSYLSHSSWYLDEVRIYSCDVPALSAGPTGVSASDGIYNNRVMVTWDAVTFASEYQVWRDIDPGGTGMVQIGSTSALSFNDPAVDDLQVYYYWIKACNTSGCSPVSDPDDGYADYSAAGYLFEDDFETGTFDLWTRFNDGGDWLYPCPQAAVNGLWGACVERGDNDKRKQLIDETPVFQTSFAARFSFDINDLSMAEGERFRFVQVKMGAERPFFIVLKHQGGQYYIQLNTLSDDLSKKKTSWYLLTDSPHTLEIGWQAASGAGANDGYCELYVDDVLAEAITGLDNDDIFVENFKIGFTSRLVGKSISGMFYVDDVVTSNLGHIGLP